MLWSPSSKPFFVSRPAVRRGRRVKGVGAVGDSFARCRQPGRRATNGGGPSPGRASPIGGVPPGSRLGSRQSCADLDSLVPSDGAPRRVGFFLGPGHGRQSVAARAFLVVFAVTWWLRGRAEPRLLLAGFGMVFPGEAPLRAGAVLL